MERTPGASSSVCVHAKNLQILVHGELYANLSWTARNRFAVPPTHTRIWFTNRLQAVCEPFDVLVYMRLYAQVLGMFLYGSGG